MIEEWKDVVGYEGLYQVSNLGRVKRLPKQLRYEVKDSREGFRNQGVYDVVTNLKEKILKNTYVDKGYLAVGLRKDMVTKNIRVHRLVAIAFIPNPENKPEVNHMDGVKGNNRLDNLEWVTGKENNDHALSTGLGKDNTPKLCEEDVKWIVDNVKRGCRTYGVMSMCKKYGVKAEKIRKIMDKYNI